MSGGARKGGGGWRCRSYKDFGLKRLVNRTDFHHLPVCLSAIVQKLEFDQEIMENDSDHYSNY